MKETIHKLKKEIIDDLQLAQSAEAIEEIEHKYFGRQQGELTQILRGLKDMPDQERKEIGLAANELKNEVLALISNKRKTLTQVQNVNDLTADAKKPTIGHLHPITHIKREIETIFQRLGFALVLGPEIEKDYYNFESLNIPEEHPARDMWDTFYVKDSGERENGDKFVLRTHISPVQVRVMEKFKPPFAVVSSGRVFRHEATDARHEHTYDYTEGFMVGKDVTLAQLKWVLRHLFTSLFGPDVDIKFRSSYFPFTEPSLELIMGCIFCNKKGCSVCHTGWLEMLGAGMIHPRVFEFAGYPKDTYSGFAFGIGVSRVAMLKYNIPDVRLLYQNDQRMLNQF